MVSMRAATTRRDAERRSDRAVESHIASLKCHESQQNITPSIWCILKAILNVNRLTPSVEAEHQGPRRHGEQEFWVDSLLLAGPRTDHFSPGIPRGTRTRLCADATTHDDITWHRATCTHQVAHRRTLSPRGAHVSFKDGRVLLSSSDAHSLAESSY